MSAPVPAPLPVSRFLDMRAPSGCDLLDFACHGQNAVWQAWAGLGWGWQAVIVLGVLAIILGALRGLLALVKDIAGWPGVAGVVAIILTVILAVLPKKPKGRDDFTGGEVDGPDAKGPFQFGVDRVRRKRRFNLDTSTWEDV